MRALLMTCAAPAALMALAAPARAEEAAAPATAPGDIVVTATKRSESLQSVPISVSAIGGDTLSKSRVTAVDDLVTKVANLQLQSTVGDNTPIFALRGVSMSDYSLNQSSPVATYYDEVYKGNFALLGVAMYDLERVEVLRGPQGTLYGKNTTGGAVNIIGRDAKLGETGGYLNLGYGNYNRFDAQGAVNMALTSNLAVRVAGTFSRNDGWFRSVLPGMPNQNQTREYGLRGTIHWEPTDRLKLILRGSHSYQNPYNYGIYAQDGNSKRIGGLGNYQVASSVNQRREARTDSVSLTANYELTSKLTLTSITSYDEGTLNFLEDSDGQPQQYLEVFYGDRARQFAQDLRLTSNTHGPFDFILGLYYAHEKVFNTNSFHILNGTDLTGDGKVNSLDCEAGAARHAGGVPDRQFLQSGEAQLCRLHRHEAEADRQADPARRAALYPRYRLADGHGFQRARGGWRGGGQSHPAHQQFLRAGQSFRQGGAGLQAARRQPSLCQHQPRLSRAQLQRAGLLPTQRGDRGQGREGHLL
jgi:iron complex outermembrane receptor protein